MSQEVLLKGKAVYIMQTRFGMPFDIAARHGFFGLAVRLLRQKQPWDYLTVKSEEG